MRHYTSVFGQVVVSALIQNLIAQFHTAAIGLQGGERIMFPRQER